MPAHSKPRLKAACSQDWLPHKAVLQRLAVNQVLVAFALPDDAPGGALHQDFRRAGTRVVIRTLYEAVGSSGADSQEIAGHGGGHGAVASQIGRASCRERV